MLLGFRKDSREDIVYKDIVFKMGFDWLVYCSKWSSLVSLFKIGGKKLVVI